MSATSSADVDRLTKLVLHNPAALNLLGQSTAKGEEVRRWLQHEARVRAGASPGWLLQGRLVIITETDRRFHACTSSAVLAVVAADG
jgi:hypothetical protein